MSDVFLNKDGLLPRRLSVLAFLLLSGVAGIWLYTGLAHASVDIGEGVLPLSFLLIVGAATLFNPRIKIWKNR